MSDNEKKKKKKIMNGLTSGVVYKFLYGHKGGCIKNAYFLAIHCHLILGACEPLKIENID